MADHPVTEQRDALVATTDEEYEEGHASGFVPRGTFVFVLVMIVIYIIYFALTWFEIVILRGGA